MFSIRWESLPSGKGIVFGVDFTSFVGQSDKGFTVDKIEKESDEIIEKLKDSKNDLIFQYFPDKGFEQIEKNEQSWFKF